MRTDEGRGGEGGGGRGTGETRNPDASKSRRTEIPSHLTPFILPCQIARSAGCERPRPQTAARQCPSHRGPQRPRGTAFVPGFSQTPPGSPSSSFRTGRWLRAHEGQPLNAGGAPSGRPPRPPCTGGERPATHPRACVWSRRASRTPRARPVPVAPTLG